MFNSWRISLTLCFTAINEFVTLDLIQKSLTSGCHVVKFWTLLIGSISQTLLAFNSSINFLMYPAFSKDFRSICKEYLISKVGFLAKLWPKRGRSSSRGSDGIEELNLEPSPVSTHSATPTFGTIKERAQFDNRAIVFDQILKQENVEENERNTFTTRNGVFNSFQTDFDTSRMNNAWLKVRVSKTQASKDNKDETIPCLLPAKSTISKTNSISIAHYTACDDL